MSICDSYSFKNNKNLNCFKMILKGITFPQINFKILHPPFVLFFSSILQQKLQKTWDSYKKRVTSAIWIQKQEYIQRNNNNILRSFIVGAVFCGKNN